MNSQAKPECNTPPWYCNFQNSITRSQNCILTGRIPADFYHAFKTTPHQQTNIDNASRWDWGCACHCRLLWRETDAAHKGCDWREKWQKTSTTMASRLYAWWVSWFSNVASSKPKILPTLQKGSEPVHVICTYLNLLKRRYKNVNVLFPIDCNKL